MQNKKGLSPQTKRILTGIGVAFGTVIIFFVSFFLSFNFIVNPITFTNIGDSDTEKENKELKAEVQSLQDEIEVLNTTVEKYRKSKPSAPVQSTVTSSSGSSSSNGSGQKNTTASSSAQSQSNSTSGSSSASSGTSSSGSTSAGNKSDSTSAKPGTTSGETASSGTGESSKFTPETTVTPETGIVPEVEEPITVIDISE